MATTTRDYLDYLDQEIGIAPANSQEELQAAKTIADIFEAHDLQATVQEFSAPSSAKTTLGILRIVLFLGALLAGLAGVARVVGILFALAAAALLLLDAFGNDIVRRYGPQAKSQNVIACHRASGPLVAKGNRPIVIVAHYDTPHEDFLQRIGLGHYRPLLTRVSAYCIPITAALALTQALVFLPEGFRRFTWVLCLIAALPVLLIGVSIVAERFMPCTPGSNDNKAAVASMLGVLEQVRPKPEIQWAVPDEPIQRGIGLEDARTAAEVGDGAEFVPVAGEEAATWEGEGDASRDEGYEEADLGQQVAAAPALPAATRHGKEILESLGMLPETCEIAYVEAPAVPETPVEERTVRRTPVIAPASRRRRGVSEDERFEELPAEDAAYEQEDYDSYYAGEVTLDDEPVVEDEGGIAGAFGGIASGAGNIFDRIRTGVQSFFGGPADELYDDTDAEGMYADEPYPLEGAAPVEGEAPLEGEAPVEGEAPAEDVPAAGDETTGEPQEEFLGELVPCEEGASEDAYAEPMPEEHYDAAFVTAEDGVTAEGFFDGEPYEGEAYGSDSYEDELAYEEERPFKLPFKLPAFIENLINPAPAEDEFYEDAPYEGEPYEGEPYDEQGGFMPFAPAEGDYAAEGVVEPQGEFAGEPQLAAEPEAEPAAEPEAEPAAETYDVQAEELPAEETVQAEELPAEETAQAPALEAEVAAEPEVVAEVAAEPEVVAEVAAEPEPEVAPAEPLEFVAEPAPFDEEAYRDFHVPGAIMDFGVNDGVEVSTPETPLAHEASFVSEGAEPAQEAFVTRDAVDDAVAAEPIPIVAPDQDSITLAHPADPYIRDRAGAAAVVEAEPAPETFAAVEQGFAQDAEAPVLGAEIYADDVYADDAYEPMYVGDSPASSSNPLSGIGGMFKGALNELRYLLSIPADDAPAYSAPAVEIVDGAPLEDEAPREHIGTSIFEQEEMLDTEINTPLETTLAGEPTEEVVLEVPAVPVEDVYAGEADVTLDAAPIAEVAADVTLADEATVETAPVTVPVAERAIPSFEDEAETEAEPQPIPQPVDEAIIAEVGKMSPSVDEGSVGEIDTGGLHITGNEDLVDSEAHIDTTRPKPANPDDPNWGVSSFTPSAANVARRAALFDLPDPSAEEIDPLGVPVQPSFEPEPSALESTAPGEALPDLGPAMDTFAAMEAIPETDHTEFNVPGGRTRVSEVDTPDRKRFRLFGRKEQPSTSMSEWLGVDDDFDAKEEGRSIGSWENFSDNVGSDDDGWKGGAAPSAQLRLVDDGHDGEVPSEQELREAILGMGDDELIAHDIWFVALGASGAEHAGIQAFLDEYRTSCRGSFVINLDCVGAGELSILSSEGLASTRKADKRVSRLLTSTAADLHIPLVSAPFTWADTDATPAMRKSMRSVTIAGLDESGYQAFSGSMDDLPANIIEEQVQDVADLVAEVIRRS